jgi:acyl-CoA thioesterase FadM
VLADGYAVMVAYDNVAGRSIPVPDLLRERLLADGAQQRSGPPPGA